MLDTFQRYKEAYILVEKISRKEEVLLLDVGSNGRVLPFIIGLRM